MAFEKRDYSGGAVPTTLAASVSESGDALTLNEATNWPSGGVNGPFTITVDRGKTTEERILVQSRSGTTLTVRERGFDGTTAVAHGIGATVEHSPAAQDFVEANLHITTARDDHLNYMRADGTRHDLAARHQFGAAFPVPGNPVTLTPGVTATPGSGAAPAREDHMHALPAASAVTITGTNAEGDSNAVARANHNHALGNNIIATNHIQDSAVTPAKLNSTAMSKMVPVGAVIMWMMPGNPPTGFLFCEGAAVSRTTYAALFAVIGTTYGAGNGTTTFNLPDLRGVFPLGAGGIPGRTVGSKGGNWNHTHELDNRDAHARLTWTVDAQGNDPQAQRLTNLPHQWKANGGGPSSWGAGLGGDHTSGVALGGATDPANPPYAAVRFIIKH